MKKDLMNRSMLVAAGILVAASMAFAKSPNLDLGQSAKTSTPVKTDAKGKKHKSPANQPMDAIQVIGHIPLTGGPVTHFVCTHHYSNDYLYAEHGTGQDITLIDVTKAEQPSVLADVPDTPGSGSEGLVAVAGTAALVTSEQSASGAATTPQTLRIMDFSHPQNPKIVREFEGVTATGRDDERGLVFVANSSGIWILQEQLAEDPKVEAEYARYVLHGDQ